MIGLLKAADSSLIPKLETFILGGNAIAEVVETQFINNGNQKPIGFPFNDLTLAPVITGSCNNLDRLRAIAREN